jgi:hypothetical protein
MVATTSPCSVVFGGNTAGRTHAGFAGLAGAGCGGFAGIGAGVGVGEKLGLTKSNIGGLLESVIEMN